MSNTSLTPLQTGFTRVFLISGKARGDHKPSFENCLRGQAPSQGFGAVTAIENPDPNQYGKFVEIGKITGATERPTIPLQGRYSIDIASALLELARKGCPIDVQINFGACKVPQEYDSFDKKLIFEEATITNWSADELGALTSADNKEVNEVGEISAKNMYEVLPVGFGVKAASIVTNEVMDVVVADNQACGDCGAESDGCYKIFAVTKSAGGSPTTPPDIVFSIDKGTTWFAHDIDSMATAETATGVAKVGKYIVAVTRDAIGHHWALLTDFDGVTDPTFTEVTTGYVAKPHAIWSVGTKAFIVGEQGYIYSLEDPTGAVSVLDAGSATTTTLRAVHALNENFAVAVGDGGAIVYTENGTTWTLLATSPVGIAVTINCIWVKSESEWWVGTSTGRMYYTLDKGKTWTQKSFSGSGAGGVYDIFFSTPSVGWMAHATAAPRGRIFRTYNGGYSWVLMPETGTLHLSDRINSISGCLQDPNFCVGVGLADDGADGEVVVGMD